MTSAALVRQTVQMFLDNAKAQGHAVSPEQLREWVRSATQFVRNTTSAGPHEDLDEEQLIRDIEASNNVFVGNWSSLSDDADHLPWLPEKLESKKDWPFWQRYQRFLKNGGMPSSAISRLDEVTDDILGRLEDPEREGPWDRRGLVAGQVQSGKTGNYIGLVAKAIDNGYKLIVILAGIHNSLRSQTQSRIDEGILGFDTRKIMVASKAADDNRIGVGRLAGHRLIVNSFTSSAENGDFRLTVAKNLGVAPGGADPIVLVVKKNKSILTNLYKWATNLTKEVDPHTGKNRVRGVPMLMIDDEADHASVNTKAEGYGDEETDPSVINGLIRKFMDTFDRASYIAYTATPFANIFIDPDADHSAAGRDLFPRSFILNLPVPSTYVGPERVFGLREDTENAIEAVEALPIFRGISDHEAWLPDLHKAGDLPGEDLPESLIEATLAFLMAGAVRQIRGQGGKHHSMLVHVTRYISTQARVGDQLRTLLEDMQRRLRYGEGAAPTLRSRAKQLYEDDFVPTHNHFSRHGDMAALTGEMPPFEDLWAALDEIASRTHVRVLNGRSEDSLTYVDHPEGVSVIAVGGDKLSRGLTLEGLSVSYYLRASRMYDTLMQMGRWFGYRPGYMDLCRLYTTSRLKDWYERITAATAELQNEFDAMSAVGKTPEEFGLRVRQHPDGLLVTSPAKLRHAQKLSVSFSGSIAETVTFRAADRPQNWSALTTLTGSLGQPVSDSPDGTLVWRNVHSDLILGFLANYRAERAAIKVQPTALSSYITSRVADNELTSWTVVLGDVQSGSTRTHVGPLSIGLTTRQHHNPSRASTRYTIRRLVSPHHELIDMVQGSPEWDEALRETVEAWEQSARFDPNVEAPRKPSAFRERRSRHKSQGLLLLYALDPSQWSEFDNQPDNTPFVGFATSFPWSDRAKPIEYQVNLVELKKEFGWDDEEFEDE
ncbi:Z1 domain-containing protein [Propioniciclava sp. MC1595]|uniref:Z1 domain-containing protein n=1 Tax=Propioniciclava sp. MC1595 TaxID=2760308 RepID=UPI00166254DF|nr:Z1 domain-containing protein [Propioniciclava sp. MC1595]MBB1496118.1 Z1 domain-containing protein [Propioniciclava sp. MC1595]QTE26397.1 Z1 domain-containing protein [Propioniciclava sp. MC1595]